MRNSIRASSFENATSHSLTRAALPQAISRPAFDIDQTLAGFVPALRLVDDVDPALAAHDPVVAMTSPRNDFSELRTFIWINLHGPRQRGELKIRPDHKGRPRARQLRERMRGHLLLLSVKGKIVTKINSLRRREKDARAATI